MATPTVAAEAGARLGEEAAPEGGQRPERSATQNPAKNYDRYTYDFCGRTFMKQINHNKSNFIKGSKVNVSVLSTNEKN